LQPHWPALSFAIFSAGVLASPESLFMCSVVWRPYHCLRRLASAPPERRVLTLAAAIAKLAVGLVAILLAFIVFYRL